MGFAPGRHGHHQHLGRLQHTLHLKPHKVRLARTQGLGGAQALLFNQRMDAAAHLRIAHADKAPGLHKADAGRMVRRPQQAQQDGLFYLATGKVAHVAPLMDGAVDRCALGLAKGCRGNGGGVDGGGVGVAHASNRLRGLSLQCRAAQGCQP